jgi:hypothetical protein
MWCIDRLQNAGHLIEQCVQSAGILSIVAKNRFSSSRYCAVGTRGT